MINLLRNNKEGNIALIVLLVSSLVALLIGLGVQSSIAKSLKGHEIEISSQQTFFLVESCFDEVLWHLREDQNYNTSSLSIPIGTCTVLIQSYGNNRTINISAQGSAGVNKKIEANITLENNAVTLNSWKEL